MIALLETTDWGKEKIPNHTYILSNNKEKMIAYVNKLDGKLKVFTQPMSFSRTGRKFKEVKDFDFIDIEKELESREV